MNTSGESVHKVTDLPEEHSTIYKKNQMESSQQKET